ncbi:putative spermidine/putrescine transport system permease protein [Tistlia consotensis]|uniref:Putative spermidine/putrescine transport system permease protein n=1 Tax=Tistlia consotensis USBA 355 TaxID=560819 RepID=A0A1Y6BZJ3_9PROT|nr:ABC transporter permease [Tistlia consotensis]SMF36461.1 putative spermidine/putrescine transport system permease protein [Tistlia consotensis USBA 355]SNR71947.1 putative spermidine/putrescine transport system permease protein [Tistlia consotensis]
MQGSLKPGGYGLLVLPACALLLVFFAYPVFWLLLRSISEPHWGFANFQVLYERSIYLKVLLNTVVISLLVTLCCAVIGYPLAYTMAHGGPRVRRLLTFVVLVPFWTSILVRTFAWMVILQRQGLINDLLLWLGLTERPLALVYNRTGVLIGMTQILLPFMIFPLYSVMLRIDRSCSWAAATLGAPPLRNFLRIYLPLSLPGLMTGGTLVFIVSLGYFITPALLGGQRDIMIAQLIEQQISNFGNWGLAGALSLVLLAGTALCLALVRRFVGGQAPWGRR